MTAVILALADRQSRDVQSRAIAAVSRQREQAGRRRTLDELLGMGCLKDARYCESLDAWYRAQPIPAGRIRRRLRLSPDEARAHGVPVSARLIDLVGLGAEADHPSVVIVSTLGGRVVGVKATNGEGVGVLWRNASKATDYALRLSIEHEMPIRVTDA